MASYNEPMRRVIRVAVLTALLILAAGALALWLFLASWVPAKGKALLIQQLEQQDTFRTSIGSLRFHPIRGLLLEQVRIVERRTNEIWCNSSLLQARVNWLTLLLQHTVTLRGHAVIEAPCPAHVSFTGRYQLKDKSLTLHLQTNEIALHTIVAPLTRYLPPSLKDGVVRIQLHVSQPSQGAAMIAGRITGSHLLWHIPSTAELTGDWLVDGTAAQQPSGRWAFDAHAIARQAAAQQVPLVGSITQLEGSAHVTNDWIEIERINGTLLGSPWTLEGTIGLGTTPRAEVLLTSHTNLAPLIAAVPALAREWQPTGTTAIRAVCRSTLPSLHMPDCLIQTAFKNLTLQGIRIHQPVTHIAGAADYDTVMRQLTIHSCEAQLMNERLTGEGWIILRDATPLSLHVQGNLPLQALAEWLPQDSLVASLDGLAALDLHVGGTQHSPISTGRVELRDVQVRLTSPAATLEHITGPILLNQDRIELQHVTFQLNEQPIAITSTVIPSAGPHIDATIDVPRGQLRIASRISPEAIVIEDGQIHLPQSQAQFRGQIAKRSESQSTLGFLGTIELSELQSLPFLPLPQLAAWKLRGLTTIDATFQGSLSHWQRGRIQGRLRADQLSLRDIPLKQVTCMIEQNAQGLRVEVPFALAAQGKFSGTLTLEHRPPGDFVLLESDLVGLQLAQLEQVIPAWHGRGVTGTASAHAVFSGTWPARPSWRSEGWLNISGEHLGEIPLLDRLFHGLFGMLADRLGLEMLRRAELHQAAAQWQLVQERFQMNNLRLSGLSGAEPITIYATGSVGLDQTLDFVIEPELSEGVLLQAPTTSALMGTVLRAAGQLDRFRRLVGRHRLTGTLKNPQYRFEFSTQELLKQLAPAPADVLQSLLNRVR